MRETGMIRVLRCGVQIMSDYREIKIIVNVIGKGNLMTDELGGWLAA